MKVNKNVFLNCLDSVLPAVDNNSLFDEYQNFNFCGKKVQATNGNIWIESVLPEGIELEASVPAVPLYNLLKKMTGDDVSLEIKDGKLHVKTDAISGDFVVQPSKIVKPPILGKSESGISGDTLNDLIDGLQFCRYGISKDDTSGPFCGVKVHGGVLWGCDRYRILRWDANVSGLGFNFCLPKKVVNLLVTNRKNLQILDFSPGKNFGGVLVVSLNNGSTIWALTLEGEYKDLGAFFPAAEDMAEKVKLDEKFPEILERHLAILADAPAEDKEMSFQVGSQIATTVSKKFTVAGELERSLTETSNLAAPRDGADFEFSVNPLLLRDVLGFCWMFEYYPAKNIVLFEGPKFKYLVKVRRQQ